MSRFWPVASVLISLCYISLILQLQRRFEQIKSIFLQSVYHVLVVVVVVYIFSATSIIIYLQSTIKNNNEEERSSGTTGTGVSQKDLQISKKTKEEEKC